MMEDDNETSSSFFSNRAKFMPKRTPEEIQAALELMNKFQEEEEEKTVVSNIKRTVSSCGKKTTKGKKKVKSNPLEDKIDITSDLFNVELSGASKRRLKKLREEREQEHMIIEAETQKILLAMDAKPTYSVENIQEVAEEFEKITVLTITYISKVSRLKCYENDKFEHIFPKVAELFDIKVTEFLLCFREKNISVDDTPKSLNLTSHDVLECIPYKVDDSSKMDSGDTENTFKIVFQSNDTRTKLDMLVHKIEKMQDIMKRYSDQRNIPLEHLVFDFDGERLSGNETPAELDMEAGNCVDVTILVPAKKHKKN